jgi:hypothetical protein
MSCYRYLSLRLIAFALAILVIAGPVLAFSDVELLKNKRSVGLFVLLPSISNNLSPGIVFNQKQNEKWSIELSCANYYKIYPFVKDVLKIRTYGKYRLVSSETDCVMIFGGPVLYFVPEAGTGFAADVGSMVSVNIFNNLAASFLADISFFRDGIGIELEPMISFAPAFLRNTEIFIGYRIEASKVGYSMSDIESSKINYYVDTGVRIGF